MIPAKTVASAVVLLHLTRVVLADSPGESVRQSISVTNAGQVCVVAEFPRRVTRMFRGPQPGELTLLDLYNSITVVDDVNFEAIRTIAANHRPSAVAVSPNGELVAWTEGSGAIYAVATSDGDHRLQIEVGNEGDAAAFSPDGALLAIGHTVWFPGAEGVGESEIKMFDPSGALVRSFPASGPGYITPVFSPDGQTLAMGNLNYETRLFEVATGELLHMLDRRGTREIAFSPDGSTLAAAYVNGDVALWDVSNGSRRRLRSTGCSEALSLDWSPNGDVLVTSGRQGRIVLWEPQRMSILKEFDAPGSVNQVRFTADGTQFLSAREVDDRGRIENRFTVWALAP